MLEAQTSLGTYRVVRCPLTVTAAATHCDHCLPDLSGSSVYCHAVLTPVLAPTFPLFVRKHPQANIRQSQS